MTITQHTLRTTAFRGVLGNFLRRMNPWNVYCYEGGGTKNREATILTLPSDSGPGCPPPDRCFFAPAFRHRKQEDAKKRREV